MYIAIYAIIFQGDDNMPTSDAQKKASTKWNKEHNSITIWVDKETGAKIRAAAAAAGQSVTQFILSALEKLI